MPKIEIQLLILIKFKKKVEPALFYESVHVFAHGLQALDRSSSLRLANLSCESEVPWNDGSSLFNYINAVSYDYATFKISAQLSQFSSVVKTLNGSWPRSKDYSDSKVKLPRHIS